VIIQALYPLCLCGKEKKKLTDIGFLVFFRVTAKTGFAIKGTIDVISINFETNITAVPMRRYSISPLINMFFYQVPSQ
jgi:hypothetical protein